MRFKLGLEMDARANLIITFDCAECGLPQKRAFRLVHMGDVITCACGAGATVDQNGFAGLQAQVELLRKKVSLMNTLFKQGLRPIKPPQRAEAAKGVNDAGDGKAETGK